jgi:hypothetical protein
MPDLTWLRSVFGLFGRAGTETWDGSPGAALEQLLRDAAAVPALEQRLRDAVEELDREARAHPAERDFALRRRWWAEIGDTLDALDVYEVFAAAEVEATRRSDR